MTEPSSEPPRPDPAPAEPAPAEPAPAEPAPAEPAPTGPARRASDADREQFVTLLQGAMADGRLDPEEFEERMTAAYTAKTHAELAPLTADLGPDDARPTEVKEELVLRANSSSMRRDGHWRVPRRLVIEAKSGSILVDLTDAELPGPHVDIEIDVSSSSVRLQLPPDSQVDHDELEMDGSSWSGPRQSTATPRLQVRITGHLRGSSVVVRDHLGRWARWRRRRPAAKAAKATARRQLGR